MFRISVYDGRQHPAPRPYHTAHASSEREARQIAARMLKKSSLRGASSWDRYQGGVVYQFGPRSEDNEHDFVVITEEGVTSNPRGPATLRITRGYEMPSRLSALGQKAYSTIMGVLESLGKYSSRGRKVFYSPAEWKALGETYGLKSELIITYVGDEHGRFFEYDYRDYAAIEKMSKALDALGLYSESGTAEYSAVYRG